MSWEQQCKEDARLVILAELAQQQPAPTLNSRNLAAVVETVVPRKPREWIEAQLVWLDDMDAVNIVRADLPGLGPVIIATLTRTGRDHVERRGFIPGVSRPGDEE